MQEEPKPYEPSEEEIKKAEGMMMDKQKEINQGRASEMQKAEDFARKIVAERLNEGILVSSAFHLPIEIAPESRSPRLNELLSWIEQNGPAKNWAELEGLNLQEEDFSDNFGKEYSEGRFYLIVDNSGSISVIMRSRWLSLDTEESKKFQRAYPEQFSEFHTGNRPELGVAHFDYSEAPEWLKMKFQKFWGSWGKAAKEYYDAKEKSTDRFGGHFD